MYTTGDGNSLQIQRYFDVVRPALATCGLQSTVKADRDDDRSPRTIISCYTMTKRANERQRQRPQQ